MIVDIINKAKVPILKMKDVVSGVNFDLSFGADLHAQRHIQI